MNRTRGQRQYAYAPGMMGTSMVESRRRMDPRWADRRPRPPEGATCPCCGDAMDRDHTQYRWDYACACGFEAHWTRGGTWRITRDPLAESYEEMVIDWRQESDPLHLEG